MDGWLLLAASLKGGEANSARVRLWRSLKDSGAASLRDGVTLIPASPATRDRYADIVGQIETEGGTAWVFDLPAQAPPVERKLRALFSRNEAYQSMAPAVAALRKELPSINEAIARRRLRQIEREFQSIVELDFFAGTGQKRLRDSVDRLRASIDRRFSPAEPAGEPGEVRHRDRADFQGVLWATRKRLWVDRVASAWLIRRFIDRNPTFEWLERAEDCPADAHGFDFPGATFTHVGELVTFEVLLEAFDMAGEPGLSRLGRLIHHLDVGGDPVPEAAGFEAVLAGLRERSADDDALLEAATPVLDALHQHFEDAPR